MVASAARVGLAGTFEGQELVPSERFFGWRRDDGAWLSRGRPGPPEPDRRQRAGGGRALLILNGELRFPIYRWLRGVGFVDLGNVYPVVGDMSLTDLQAGSAQGCASLRRSASSSGSGSSCQPAGL